MTACLNSETLSITADVSPNSCTGYVLVSSAEYQILSSPFAEFDSDLFLQVLGFFLACFVTAFCAGICVKKLGR